MIDVPLINEWTARTHTRRFRTEHRRDQGLIKEFYGGAAMDQSGYLLHDSLTPQIEVLAEHEYGVIMFNNNSAVQRF